MKPITPFVITSFTNPSWDVVFHLSCWLDGKRIRKNFSTRADADAERQVLEVQRAQGESGIRTAITRLSDEQIGEAEILFARAQGGPRPLAFYLDYASRKGGTQYPSRRLAALPGRSRAGVSSLGAVRHAYCRFQTNTPTPHGQRPQTRSPESEHHVATPDRFMPPGAS